MARISHFTLFAIMLLETWWASDGQQCPYQQHSIPNPLQSSYQQHSIPNPLQNTNNSYQQHFIPDPIPKEECSCGRALPARIVDGIETGVNEFPSMAAIVYVHPGYVGSQRCGATIVSSSAALTAAHCVEGVPPNELGLIVGDHDLSTETDTSASRLYRVSSTIMRDGFNILAGTNDIAIVLTTMPIQFSRQVGPACLPFNIRGNLENEYVTAAGWGLLAFGGKKSTVLRKVTVQIIPNSLCKTSYPDKSISSNVLCAYERRKDTCQFDSGGPLYYVDPRTNLMNVVGVINYGRGCASLSPSVNARVSEFLDWIRAKLPGESFCVK